MTLINFVSGFVYTKGFPLKDKVQLYGVGLLFLVLLYNSPSGLVLYWICNNLFSLVKNVVNKSKNPNRFWHSLITLILFIAGLFILKYKTETALNKRIILLLIAFFVAVIPYIYKKSINYCNHFKFPEENKLFTLTLLSGGALALFGGLVLSVRVLGSSPSEFSFLGNTENPLNYVKSSVCFFIGLCLIWPLIVYKMFNYKVKVCVSCALFIAFVSSVFNSLVFKCYYGDLNSNFDIKSGLLKVYDKVFIPLTLFIIVISLVFYLFFVQKKFFKYFNLMLFSVFVAEGLFGIQKIYFINKDFYIYKNNRVTEVELQKEYNLSKDGKNVIVFFLDRGIGAFVPEIFENYPVIKEQFKEFTYYPNTVSFSNYTVTGSPPILGGYEYNQICMNNRKSEKLINKHNEATLVMPVLFDNGGYEVTLTDIPWPNYSDNDYTAFNEYPSIKCSSIQGKYYPVYTKEKNIHLKDIRDLITHREINNFGIIQMIPCFTRVTFNNLCRKGHGNSMSSVYSPLSNLYYLGENTDFNSKGNTFTFIGNETAHNPYFPYRDDLESITTGNVSQTELHFMANAASFKQIGKWLDYLKSNDCYNNTRIILVSDHGYHKIEAKSFNLFEDARIPSSYNALLMVKDFNQKEYRVDNTFMTNADTLFLAKEGLNLSDTNPFTGKAFTQNKENGIDVYMCQDCNANYFKESYQFELDINNAYHVQNDIYNPLNWTPLSKKNTHLAMNVGE